MVTALFLDIGGVLLTDGWNTHSRKAAAKAFNIDSDEMESRHHLTYDTYESGKIPLDIYLKRIIFYENREFTVEDFKEFMYAQSQPFNDMINLIKRLKEQYKLKIAVVSNEGREITEYRIKKFKLNTFVDFFISSSFVHLRKPDTDIFKVALDIAQVSIKDIIYIEDRPMFVQVAATMGIKGIKHVDYKTTCEKLTALGLACE